MKSNKFIYLLAFLLLVVFASDLQGQFRRKKVKLSQNNQIEEFINDYIQDPFMVEHIQALQSELVDIGFEILAPETDGNCEVEILFEDLTYEILPERYFLLKTKYSKYMGHIIVNLFDCINDSCYRRFIMELPRDARFCN